MARPRGRPKTGRTDISVKLDRTIAMRAKAVAAYRGVSLAELLSNMLQDPVRLAFGEMLRDTDKPDHKKGR